MSGNDFYYSPKYYDDEFEYSLKAYKKEIGILMLASAGFTAQIETNTWQIKHVVLPKELVKLIPKSHLMSEEEWRGIGIQQSAGWIHYMVHDPEPHVVLFKRPITRRPQNRV